MGGLALEAGFGAEALRNASSKKSSNYTGLHLGQYLALEALQRTIGIHLARRSLNIITTRTKLSRITMNMKSVLFYNIALFLVLASYVQASLYPTHPIKNTVYLAGKAAGIMWIEGGGKPLLKKMGTVQIDLYTNHDTYVSTLAKNVPATAGSTTCFIPADVPSNVLSFNLRFITTSPPTIIYTADFSILGGTGEPVYPLSAEEEDDPSADNGDGGTQDPNTTTTPDSNTNDPQDPTDPTITDPNSPGPNPQPNSNSTDTNSSTSGPPPAVSTIIAPPLGKGEVGSPAPTPTPTPNTVSGSGSGSGTSRLPYSAAVRSDLESLGFRTAIVLWPAVVGISMAL